MSDSQVQFGAEPQDEIDLKAERVQLDLAGTPPLEEPQGLIEERLKAERVQERLKRMPGWSLAKSGQAIGRARELPSAFGATDYAIFVLREAARTRQRVQ